MSRRLRHLLGHCRHRHPAAGSHQPQLVAGAADNRPGFEDVNHAGEPKAFLLENPQGWSRLFMHLADHRLGCCRQERNVDRMLRHQIGDEPLVQNAEVVSLGKVDCEKMLADGIPKLAVAPVVNHAPHLGNHGGVKALRMLSDEQKPGQRKTAADPATPGVGVQEHAADLAGAVVLLHQMQRANLLADAEVF